jgi:hypothetical protein
MNGRPDRPTAALVPEKLMASPLKGPPAVGRPQGIVKTMAYLTAWIIGLTLTAGASMFSLEKITLPLWYDGEAEQGIQTMSVPKVVMSTEGGWGRIDLFDDPFEQYDPRRPATNGLGRTEDLNMIFAYGITTSAVYDAKSNPDVPVKLVIDISGASKAHKFSIMEVAQAAAACIRDLFPKDRGVPLVLKDKDKEVEFEPPF